LSPWITPPWLLVTDRVNAPLVVTSVLPPVMPWRAPSILPCVSLTTLMPVLLCASTPSLLLVLPGLLVARISPLL